MKLIKTAFAAAILVAGTIAASAQAAPKMNLCTGGSGGVYEFSGHAIKKFSDTNSPSGKYDVSIINTAGSIENLDKIVSGECDAAIVQNDAFTVYSKQNAKVVSATERAGVLYKEYLHLVCNRSVEVGKISKLKQNVVVSVGPDGGGAAMTWKSIAATDPKHFEKIQVDPKGGVRALSSIADGTDVQCGLFVTGLGNALMVNDAAKFAQRLVLVPINSDLDTLKDPRGRQLYSYDDIPYDTYKGIIPSGMLGRKNVPTATVDAIVVVSTKWIDANSSKYDAFLRNIASAIPAIEKRAYNR